MAKRGRLAQFTFVVIVAAAVAAVASPADAKMLPLEVQVSDGSQAVRISPVDFIDAINGPGARGRFGIFEYAPEPRGLKHPPLNLKLIVYASRSTPGGINETFGPDVVRETFAEFEYYRTDSGAVGKLLRGLTTSHREWVRFTPTFWALIDDALASSPKVTPVDPPLRSNAPRQESYLSDLVVPALSLAVVIGLVFVLIALRISRKAAERDRRSPSLAGERGDAVKAG